MRCDVSYFEDVDSRDTIVRKRAGVFELEYISKKNPVWTKAEPNSSYEREFYLGEGNCCLFGISCEEAERRMKEWGKAEDTHAGILRT